jgi:protein SCO1
MAKMYRLYFSAPPSAIDDDENDYLVDHSIFFYFMGPNNEFIQNYGRNETSKEIAAKIKEQMLSS